MLYTCTYITEEFVSNLLRVFIPSLKKVSNSKIVVYGYGLSAESNRLLIEQGVLVFHYPALKDGREIGKYRLIAHKEFLQTIDEEDRVLLIDGADTVFQKTIDNIPYLVRDYIGFVTVENLTHNENTPFRQWSKYFLSNNPFESIIWELLKDKEVANVAFLVGKKKPFLELLDLWQWFTYFCGARYFWGINVITFNYMVELYSNKFQKLPRNCCYDYTHIKPIKKDGYYVDVNGEIVAVAHFNLNDDLYNKEFLSKGIKK